MCKKLGNHGKPGNLCFMVLSRVRGWRLGALLENQYIEIYIIYYLYMIILYRKSVGECFDDESQGWRPLCIHPFCTPKICQIRASVVSVALQPGMIKQHFIWWLNQDRTGRRLQVIMDGGWFMLFPFFLKICLSPSLNVLSGMCLFGI